MDAPSVHASKICSLEFSTVQPRSWGTGHSEQIQYSTVSRHISVLLQDYWGGVGVLVSWRNMWFSHFKNKSCHY